MFRLKCPTLGPSPTMSKQAKVGEKQKKVSFTEVLSLLRTKRLLQYAETLEEMGVESPEDLAARSLAELCAAGVREDHTLVLTQGLIE